MYLQIFLLTLHRAKLKVKIAAVSNIYDDISRMGKQADSNNCPHCALCTRVQLAREFRGVCLGGTSGAQFSLSKFLVSRPFLVNYSPTILRRFLAGPVPSNNAASTARYYLLSNMKEGGVGDVHFISISGGCRRWFRTVKYFPVAF